MDMDASNAYEGVKESNKENMNGSNSWAPSSTGSSEVKRTAVCAEMDKLKQHPKGSYSTNRLLVLNKILQLMSVQRTRAQEEELELLFAGLSL